MQEQKINADGNQKKAWWHHGYAWLAFSGPAAVVVASLITVYIAVSHRDPVIDEDYYQKGIDINKTLANQSPDAETPQTLSATQKNALEPAMLARNHAATGVNK